MILDRLDLADRYAHVHRGFHEAFAYLRLPDLRDVPDGRHTLNGEQLYASVERRAGRGRAGAPLEFHRKYIDIQYVIAGDEVMGWRSLADCREPSDAYDPARDIGFFRDAPLVWVPVPAGSFAIFFPDDAHAPLAGDGPVHKVVMKIAVD